MTVPMLLRIVIETLLIAGGVALLVPVLVLLVQVFASLLPRRHESKRASDGAHPRIAVLIPAHDESVGLLPTLRAVLPQLQPGDRCLVVADNCDDDTAQVAASAGADVVERFDAALRGKGYALDFGMTALAADPPDVVVVVDADCVVAAGAIALLARTAVADGRPAQALYLMRAPSEPKRSTQIAEFAFRVKNWARALGFHRLGLPCPLMGTGMAFPWRVLRSVDLASGHIVEDMKMGIDLATAGFPPLFCPEASVWSSFPANDAGAKSQRTRWEHGHLGMIVGVVPGLLWRALKRRDGACFAMALDLLVPPLALLVMIAVAHAFACAVAGALGASWWPLVLSLTVLLCLFVAVATAWLRYGRAVLPLATLAMAPLYALRKIPLYLKFLVARQGEWVRSKRDAQ